MADRVALTADWSVLEIDGAMEVAEQVARRVARQYTGLEFDDLLQEAHLVMAVQAPAYRSSFEGGGLGGIHHRLWCDLVDHCRPRQAKANRTDSFEGLMERLAEAEA